MLVAIVQEFETSIFSKQPDVCPNPKVRHTKPAIPTEIHGNLARCDDVPCTTCFTRLAPYPASAKALKVPDIQRSKPGNRRRKKKSEKTLKNHESDNSFNEDFKRKMSKNPRIHGANEPRTGRSLGWKGSGREFKIFIETRWRSTCVFFKEKKEDGVPPVEEDLWAGSLSLNRNR